MIDLDSIGRTIGPIVHEYGTKDVILYHLGIGARTADLDFVYEGREGGPKVCPTYGVVTLYEVILKILPLFNVPMNSILHGEQAIILQKSIPPRGKFLTKARVPIVYDKGKAALLPLEAITTDESGDELFSTKASLFCQGAGGFGGDAGPKSQVRRIPADRRPDFEISYKTAENQAALYRLSGDLNPLHIDPSASSAAGFASPILHGLCTYGFVARGVLEGACGNDVNRLKEFGVRFTNLVFPGDTITTRGWKMGIGVYHLQVLTERGEVMSNAYACVD